MVKTIPELTESQFLRFRYNVDDEVGDGKCWEWRGPKIKAGYGKYTIGFDQFRAPRVAYKISKGDPKDLFVLHKCDNPGCVNPDHLFLGTDKDNAADSISKGRKFSPRGESHPFAKLNPEKVVEIRKLREEGWTLKKLADFFMVAIPQIFNVCAGKSWKHVALIFLFLSILIGHPQTSVTFNLSDPQFGISQTTNVEIILQQVGVNSSGTTVLLPITLYGWTSTNGSYTFTNIAASTLLPAYYKWTVPANSNPQGNGPSQTYYGNIIVQSTNLGLIAATTIGSPASGAVYPAGSGWAWSAQASDLRYSPSAIALTNYVLIGTLLNTSNALVALIPSTNGLAGTNLFAPYATTNFVLASIMASNANLAATSQVQASNTVTLTITTNNNLAFGLAGTNFGFLIGLNATNFTQTASNSVLTNLQSQIFGTNLNTLTLFSNLVSQYTLTNQFVFGTNNIATNATSQLNSASNSLVLQIAANSNGLNFAIGSSNLLTASKQPSSTWLTNISATGAMTNNLSAGQNFLLTTNLSGNTTILNATNQTFLTNGMTPIVFLDPSKFLTSNNIPSLTNGFVGSGITNGFETSSHAAATYYPTSNPSLFINNSALTPYLTSNAVYSAIQSSNANLATLSQVAASNAVAATMATNIALQVGLANSNLSYTIGGNDTNNVILASNRITAAYLISIGNTNLTALQGVTNFVQSQIASSNANFATRSQVSDTNTVNLTGTTNQVLASGLAGTNFGYGIGLNSTNFTLITSNSIVTNLQAQILGTNFNTLTIITNLIGNVTNSTFVARSNGFASRLTATEWLGLGTKTNFVLSTNVIGILGGGSVVEGTYVGAPFSATWTNVFNSTNTILFSVGNYYIQSNGVSLYASADAHTWTVVNGAAPAPTGDLGSKWHFDGVKLDGWIYATNLTWQITNSIGLANAGLTNFDLSGFVQGFTTNNQISTSGSNVVIDLIGQYGVNPTNGISTNTALVLINAATNSLWAGVTNLGAVQWGSTTNPLTSPRPATFFLYVSNNIPQFGIWTTN